jgi:hypothetical protein
MESPGSTLSVVPAMAGLQYSAARGLLGSPHSGNDSGEVALYSK